MNIKAILRTILHKKKSSTFILLGTVIGITSVILIYLWLIYQTTFDRFHENYDQIYRVIIAQSGANNSEGLAEMHADIQPLLQENIPEIGYCARFKPFDRCVVKKGENLFYESGIAAVDSSFFDIFSFSLIATNGNKPMRDPFEVYISKEIADKYFGNGSAINQTFRIDTLDVMVGGVFESWPDNSHLTFDILIPHDLLKRFGITHPWNNYLYVTIENQSDIPELNKKISDLAKENNAIISRLQMELGLQPLADIHFTTWLGSELARTERKSKLYFFGAIALLILIFSVINFTILIFVDQLKNLRDIAIKKTIGSSRRNLVLELMIRSVILIIVAFIISACIAELVKPQFVRFTNANISETGIGFQGVFLLFGIFILAALVGGMYPNLLLSSLSPSFILRIDSRFKTRNITIRNILLVIQFAVSMVLIVCTIISVRQLNFMLNYDLGLKRENIIMIAAREPFVERFDLIKQELLKHPQIEGVTLQSRPFFSGGQDYVRWEGKQENENVIVDVFAVEYDFFDVIGMEILAGRNFSQDILSDKTGAFIINQKAADQIGFKDPLGKRLWANQRGGEIIGLVNDAYFRSLKKDIEPAVFYIYDSFVLPWLYTEGSILVKFMKGREKEIIDILKKLWEGNNPDQPFEYEFLDKRFDSLYENEKRNILLFEFFSAVAILISCLGLYAVVSHVSEERSKEIGIRKVVGATSLKIVSVFSINLFWNLLVSAIISIPISFYLMNNWLQNFTQRLPIPVWIFVVALMLTGLVTYLTMIFTITKVAGRNPVESLRYE